MPVTREQSGRASGKSRTTRSDKSDLGTLSGLRARCERLRQSLSAPTLNGQPTASDAELAAYWPGSEKNPSRRLGGWIFCYANYVRFNGRRERTASSEAQLRETVRAAMGDQAEFLELSIGRVGVYPKSLDALAELDALNDVIAAMLALRMAACATASVAIILDENTLRSLAVRVWCWIATDERSELPYAPGEDDPAIPEWTRQITPQDFDALVAAHRRVNRQRNARMLEQFPKDEGARPSKLGFEGFVGTFAGGKGLDSLDVVKRWSLGRVLAIALSEATAAKELQVRLDAERKARA